MKKVLITGANSYIGVSFENYVKEHYSNELSVDTVDMIDGSWRQKDFRGYDVVFHVAGLAHADVGNVSDEVKKKYYAVNTDLAIETAKKAKADGVKQFVFMSSAIIYGDSAPYGKKKVITAETKPQPSNFYGDSKWQADKGVRVEADKDFIVTVLRPPMIYGKGSKGNYPLLSKFAKKLPIFPDVQNERSMLYIENLCEFLCQVMMRGEGGVFWPQNSSYSNTSKIVKYIGYLHGHKVVLSKLMGLGVRIAACIPGKIGGLANKAFGNLTYDKSMSKYDFKYQKYSLKDSLIRTETDVNINDKKQKHILIITQYFYPETFRINDMAREWVKRGYKVTVLTGIPNYPMGKYYEGYDRKHRTRENWNGVNIIRIPLIARGNSSNKLMNAIGMTANYFSFVVSGRKWVRSKEAQNLHADLVYTFEVSPMTQALIGVWYRKRYHVPHYLYVTDLWPENVESVTGIHNKLIINPIQRMVDHIYNNADRIFTCSKSFIPKIKARGVSEGKIEYWPQYAEEFYKPVTPEGNLLTRDGVFNLVFAGSVGYAQGLNILVKAAVTLKNDDIQARFNIIGDGRYLDTLQESIRTDNVERYFTFIPRQPAEEISKYLAFADALLITLSKNEVFSITLPAKVQSCFACGKPIIVSADGEAQNAVNEAKAGLCSDAEDLDGFVENIKTIINLSKQQRDEMGNNALKYAAAHFDKNKQMDRLDEVFKNGGVQ